MIKLENSGGLPQSRCLIVVQSETDLAAVSVSTENVREEVRGEWVDSTVNVRQTIGCFIEGKPFKLGGKIASAYAVECPAAFKVVCEVEAKMDLTTAYEKGDKSKEFCRVALVRVVEVWASATKCLWRAQDGAKPASEQVATLGANGRINKPEAVART